MESLYSIVICSLCFQIAIGTGVYHAEEVIEARVQHLRKMCQKYKDPRLVEHQALYHTVGDVRKVAKNLERGLFICAPPKVASQSWSRLMRQLFFQDKQNYLEKHGTEKNWTKVELEAIKAKRTSAMIIRHPLERILSSYLFLFLDSSIHVDLTRKIEERFLSRHKFLTSMEKPAVDSSDRPTLSFRQFVNFINLCSMEDPECRVMTNEGMAEHWAPYWRWCQPCNKDMNYKYVLELDHIVADKEFLFRQEGLNNSLPLQLKNATKRGSASNMEIKQKYFSQLSKQEVHDLYLRYKLDHDLFGYSADEYLGFAKEK